MPARRFGYGLNFPGFDDDFGEIDPGSPRGRTRVWIFVPACTARIFPLRLRAPSEAVKLSQYIAYVMNKCLCLLTSDP